MLHGLQRLLQQQASLRLLRAPPLRAALGSYAACSQQIPLLERRLGDEHKVGIAYDRAAGVVRLLVNGKEHFRVDRIGRRIAK